MFSGVFIFALTSLLARDGFFLFAIIGLDAKLRLSVGSDEMKCHCDRTVCLISELLSLNFTGTTSGCVLFWVVFGDNRALSFSNCMLLIRPLISLAL